MSEKVKFGVIGVGNMGGHHLDLFSKVENAELVAVCDTNTETLENAVKKHEVQGFSSSDALIESKVCDAIIIATPHYDHTTIGIKALEAGYHVLVEKPLSVHKADCQRIINAYKDKSKVFGAMFNQRTDPHYQKARELIQNGEIGTFQRVNWIITDWYRTQHYYNSGGWRATWRGEGGGVLLNQCPHNLDLIQWMCGMPTKVTAVGSIGRFHDIEVEDDITAILEYENGANGVFITTTGEAPGTNRLEIVGTKGKLIIDFDQGNGIQFTKNEVGSDIDIKESKSGFAKPNDWNINIPINGRGEQHLGIIKNFTNAILGKEELIAPAIEGINSVELGNAMVYSALHNESVTLPMDEQKYEEFLMEKIKSSKFVKKEIVSEGASDFSNSNSF